MALDEASGSCRPSTLSRNRRTSRGSLTLEVTTRCNRSCSYCYNVWKTDADYPTHELPGRELLRIVKGALQSSGFRHVQISGGEPFLRSDLFEIITGLRAVGARVSLVTDGGLIDESAAKMLADLGVAPVQPTLLAGHGDLHNAIKGCDCFDATIAAIARLQRIGVPVSVAFVCTKRNYGAFREVVELCLALGVRTIAFNRLCLSGAVGPEARDLIPDREMIASCLEVAEWANARLDMRVCVAISLPLCIVDIGRYKLLKFGRCALQSDHPGFTIDPSGNLRACSISPTILGNLLVESWQTIVARARSTYFAKMATLPDDCRDCPLRSRCLGGCRESALTCHGTLNRPDPLVCRTTAIEGPEKAPHSQSAVTPWMCRSRRS